MASLVLALLHCYSIHLSHSQWISPSTPELPIEADYHGIGHYQNAIYLVGGRPNPYGYIQYNVTNETFSYFAQSVFPIQLWAYSQWWFQIDETLYMTTGLQIHSFDLVNGRFEQNLSTDPTYQIELIHSCLTGDSNQPL